MKHVNFSLRLFLLIVTAFSFSGIAGATANPADNPADPRFKLAITCDKQTDLPMSGGEYECGYADLLALADRIIKFLIYFSTLLAVLSLSYAGFLYMTAFGNSGQVEKAHGIFSKVATGLILVFAGWLIIATILKTLGVDKAFSLIDFAGVTSGVK